ncbi:MAG: amidohydrolase family protein [Candidatus Zixiibacteriota bacterium]
MPEVISHTAATKIAYQPRWLIVEPEPVENGVIELAGDRITFAGKPEDYSRAHPDGAGPAEITRLENRVLFPGLINCHVHTNFPHDTRWEFRRGSMVDWVTGALAARGKRDESEQVADITHALKRLHETATVALGEISNDFVSLEPILNSNLICRYFCERFGFPESAAPETYNELSAQITEYNSLIRERLATDSRHPETVTLSAAPHAPYSTSAQLIRELASHGAPETHGAPEALSAIHVAEGAEETELLRSGGGPWRERLRDIGRDNPDWIAPGLSPMAYLDSIGALNKRMLLVHLTQISEDDIELIRASGASAVLCPLSNSSIGVGTPPLRQLLEAGIPVGLGTDSLASNTDLNLFAEMRELRRLNPEISARVIWNLATVGGARALRFNQLGSLAPGASPGVFSAQFSDGVDIGNAEELFARLITEGDRQLTMISGARL